MTNPHTALHDDARYIGRLAGRYVLHNRKSRSGVKIFACQAQSVSTRKTVISGPVLGKIGDKVSANIDEVGLIKGHVIQTVENGFGIAVDPETNDVHKLQKRINWLRRRGSNQADDHRQHKRFRPRNPHTTLLLGDGTQLNCFLIDVSCSGAAISADLAPQVGEPMAIGTVIGRVVRTFETGFAVRFVEPLEMTAIEDRLKIGTPGAGARDTDSISMA